MHGAYSSYPGNTKQYHYCVHNLHYNRCAYIHAYICRHIHTCHMHTYVLRCRICSRTFISHLAQKRANFSDFFLNWLNSIYCDQISLFFSSTTTALCLCYFLYCLHFIHSITSQPFLVLCFFHTYNHLKRGGREEGETVAQ